MEEKSRKLYYSISEVSEITNLKQYVLRYWETEFSNLKPSKNKAGNRTYKEKDIEVVKAIQNLLYKRKFTIEGAKLHFREMKKTRKQQLGLTDDKTLDNNKNMSETLSGLKNGLDELLDTIRSYKN